MFVSCNCGAEKSEVSGIMRHLATEPDPIPNMFAQTPWHCSAEAFHAPAEVWRICATVTTRNSAAACSRCGCLARQTSGFLKRSSTSSEFLPSLRKMIPKKPRVGTMQLIISSVAGLLPLLLQIMQESSSGRHGAPGCQATFCFQFCWSPKS